MGDDLLERTTVRGPLRKGGGEHVRQADEGTGWFRCQVRVIAAEVAQCGECEVESSNWCQHVVESEDEVFVDVASVDERPEQRDVRAHR